MDFLKLVNEGVAKSNKALAAVREVDAIYERINTDLKNYPAGELSLQRRVSTMAQLASFAEVVTAPGGAAEAEYFKHDRISLILKVDGKVFSEEVAGWKQRATGYPCILKFDGQEITCSSEAHLLDGMSELLSSVGFGNAVNKLRNAAAHSGTAPKKTRETEGAIVQVATGSKESQLRLVKRAAKQNDGVAAKPPSERVATRAAAGKVAIKSSSSKRSGKDPVPKKAPTKAVKKAVASSAVKGPTASRKGSKPAPPKARQESSVESKNTTA